MRTLIQVTLAAYHSLRKTITFLYFEKTAQMKPYILKLTKLRKLAKEAILQKLYIGRTIRQNGLFQS